MKKFQKKTKLLTKIYRMCFSTNLGFFIFTILNDYTNAYNETMVGNQGNTSHAEYSVLSRNTWLSGFNSCKNITNLQMASTDDFEDMENESYNFTFAIEEHFPLWVYGFEVTEKSTGHTFRIKNTDVLKGGNSYTCKGPNASVSTCCTSFKNLQSTCKQQHQMDFELPEVHFQGLIKFATDVYINATRFVNVSDESEFQHDTEKFSVRCLLVDENGKLKTDRCEEKHRALCIPGETQTVLKYVETERIPEYTPSTSQPTGRSSIFDKSAGTSNKHDIFSKNSTTVSINSNRVPDKPDFWMDPQIRYSVIGVGCLILLAIVVAMCCCFCRRRRKSNNKRRTAHLAEAYSEAADSIVMKETSVYETADTSEYAIPEDALKKAKHRQSIGENEYDVLQITNKSANKFTGNTYNHVTLLTSKDRRGSANQDDNTYDVTNIGKHNSVIISPHDITGNVYGEVAVNIKSKDKVGNNVKTDHTVEIVKTENTSKPVKIESEVKTDGALKSVKPVKTKDELKSEQPVKTKDELKSVKPVKTKDELKSVKPVKTKDELKSVKPVKTKDALKSVKLLKT